MTDLVRNSYLRLGFAYTCVNENIEMTTLEKQQQPFKFDPKISLIIGFSISTKLEVVQKCQIISHVVGVDLFLYDQVVDLCVEWSLADL